jgi:ABC-type glycerol-3-phosphate transport system substrate-binding protein
VLRDLTAFYNAHIKQIATPGAIVGSVLNGKVWGFSVGVYIGNLLWYNPDYLKKYGLTASSVHTWNDWIRQLQIIKQREARRSSSARRISGPVGTT